MKIMTYGGQLNDPDQIKRMNEELKPYNGTCYVSERQKKPNGVWRRKDKIDSDGVWFFKNKRGHTTFEIWKLIKRANNVVLDDSLEDVSALAELKINSDNECEVVIDGIIKTKDGLAFFLSEEYHPIAYKNKLEELVESGMNVADAKKYIETTPIDLEIYYEKGKGLFAIDCETIENGKDIYSPYSKIKLEK